MSPEERKSAKERTKTTPLFEKDESSEIKQKLRFLFKSDFGNERDVCI